MTNAVHIPSGAFLHFKHAYSFDSFEYYSSYYYDGGVVEYSSDGGTTWQDADALFDSNGYGSKTIDSNWQNPLAGRKAFVAASYGYISSRLNLASLSGQDVRFRFRIGTDIIIGALGWLIDDVRIYTCQAATVSSMTLTPDKSSPRPVGTGITFTAAASGGSGSYQYYFTYRIPAGTWRVGQAYSATPTWTWNTTGLPAGVYTIQVWTRNAGSTASYEAYKSLDYTLN
jgi:hypothetical protein